MASFRACFAYLLLASVPLLAKDATWHGTINNNMATRFNWSTDSIPTGRATFNSSLKVLKNLVWNQAAASPPLATTQFTLDSFHFATCKSASQFTFAFTGGPYGLTFTGGGLTGESTDTTLNFDNTGSTTTMNFSQLLFAPNGSSALGKADITAVNTVTMNSQTMAAPIAQVLLDGSSIGENSVGAKNKCHVTGENNRITLTNGNTGILSNGQWVIDGSSIGFGSIGSAQGGRGSASLITNCTKYMITNDGLIGTELIGCGGQWVVDGSSNGILLQSTGIGEGGRGFASAISNRNTMTLTNNGSLSSGINSSGQWVVDGSSNGVMLLSTGIGKGGRGSASYAVNEGAISLTNKASIQNTFNGAAQWMVNGSSHAISEEVITSGKATGGKGCVALNSDCSSITLANDGSIFSPFGNAGQWMLDGSSKASLFGGGSAANPSARGGNGSASLNTNGSAITLTNNINAAVESFLGISGQWVVDGSSTGFSLTEELSTVSGGSGSATIRSNGSTITLTNNGTVLATDFLFLSSAACGQCVVDGSSNGVMVSLASTTTSATGRGGDGHALLKAKDSSITIINNGGIFESSFSLSSRLGQWVVNGSSNGISILENNGYGAKGKASASLKDSSILISNSNTIQGGSMSASINQVLGQLIIDGSSSGVAVFIKEKATSVGGSGNSSFWIEKCGMTLNNFAGASLLASSGAELYGSIGQLVVNGSSNGLSGTGNSGSASFLAQKCECEIFNGGEIIAPSSTDSAGAAAQVAVDGRSTALQTGSSGKGNASFKLKKSVLSLSNSGTINGGNGSATPAFIAPAGQMVFTGSSNEDAGSISGQGKAVFTADNSKLTLSNSGVISALNPGSFAGQLVFDNSALKANHELCIAVTNETTGYLTAATTTPVQVYFHNSSIKGAPFISVANYNPSANIEGIVFDQNSSAGRSTLALEDTSLVVNSKFTKKPFTLGGLSGNAASVVKLLTNNLKINTFAGATTSFAGDIQGNWGLIITGKGTQGLTGTTTYSGDTTVNGGTLVLDGSVVKSVQVNEATITGSGSIGKNLIFSKDSTYLVQLSGIPFTTTCLHAGGTLSPAGTLQVVSTNNTWAIGCPYTILTGGKLTDSRFSSVFIDSPWLVATPLYNFDPTVQLLLSTNFSAGAKTSLQCQIAKQFDNLVQPEGDESVAINHLLALNEEQLPGAFVQMVGEPLTYLAQVNQMADRRFNGRVFEAIRNCIGFSSCCESRVWAAMEGGRYRFARKKGFRAPFFAISLGAQRKFDAVLLGVAANFEKNWLHYKQGGKCDIYTEQAAIYALWRNENLYLFSDLIGGVSQTSNKRYIRFGTLDRVARSHPNFYHGEWYAEGGVNWWCKECLIQPFFGFDVTYVSAMRFSESGAHSIDLKVRGSATACPDTYLGTHLNFYSFCTEFSADVVWRYRLGSLGTKTHNRFKEFGNSFAVKGYDSRRNSVIGRLKAARELPDYQVYGELTGEFAKGSSNLSILAGVSSPW